MFRLPDAWVWDCWLADDGRQYHLFFLFASRALGDPGRRHAWAGIGHAVSGDLRDWTRLADALVPDDPPAFDQTATWTGSLVRAPDGRWVMYYTGVTAYDPGVTGDDTGVSAYDTGVTAGQGRFRQRIGIATSTDLTTWERHPANPVLEPDGRWYETPDDPGRFAGAWRDPWVFRDPDGPGWHMLITACANHGPPDDRGVVGHATSPDLHSWTVRPPLSRPGAGFGHLEVTQLAEIDGRTVLIFSCRPDEYAGSRREQGQRGGIWSLPVTSLLGPYEIADAQPLTDTTYYAGRVVRDRAGRSVLIAFHHDDEHGFVGATSDPMPVHWSAEGILTLTAPT